jgi:hypothetical protein
MIKDLMNVATIPELISYGSLLEISHSKSFFKSTFTNDAGETIRINSIFIMERYFNFIKSKSQILNMSPTEALKYRYQPKLLSLDVYNTLDLWSLILKLNNMTSILEFTKASILIPPLSIYTIMNEILTLEFNEIKRNKLDNP